MTTQVATRAGNTAVAALQNLKHGLANVQAAIPVTNTEPFLRLLKDGLWVYGAENINVEDGSTWAINPLSIKHGFVCWTDYPASLKKKNVKVGSRMVPATEPKPDFASLPVHKDEHSGDAGWAWTDAVSFSLMCVSGEDKGEQVLYSTNSVGGLNACAELIGKIMTQLDNDPARPVPVVELLCDHYQHATYGKTYYPVLALRSWVPLTDEMPDLDEDGEPVEAEAPAGTAQTANVQPTEPAPAEQAAAPRRRRAAGSVPETKQTEQPAASTAAAAQSGASAQTEPVRRRRRTS